MFHLAGISRSRAGDESFGKVRGKAQIETLTIQEVFPASVCRRVSASLQPASTDSSTRRGGLASRRPPRRPSQTPSSLAGGQPGAALYRCDRWATPPFQARPLHVRLRRSSRPPLNPLKL